MSIMSYALACDFMVNCVNRVFEFFKDKVMRGGDTSAAPLQGDAVGKTDYPAYTIKAVDGKSFVVAGGGGAAKTGVINRLVSGISSNFYRFSFRNLA